jgi:hypothetical protein
MAAQMVDSLTSEITTTQELFDQLDPDELVEELAGPLREATYEIVDAMMLSLQPQMWRAIPDQIKDLIVRGVELRMPAASRSMFEQFKGQLDQFVYVKHPADHIGELVDWSDVGSVLLHHPNRDTRG